MNSFEDYFKKEAEKRHRNDIKVSAISKEIISLAFDLNDIIPFSVCLHISGMDEGSSIGITIYDPTTNNEIWNTEFYSKGTLAYLSKVKEVKESLLGAIKFKRLPEKIKYMEPFRRSLMHDIAE